MADFDWRETLRSVAPGIAAAFGGPLAGAAVKILGDKLLGSPNASEEDVASALANGTLTGDQIRALREAEMSFEVEMARVDQARDGAILEDKKDARAMQVAVRSWVPAALAIFVTVGFFTILLGLMYGTLNTNNDALLIMLGSLGTAWTGIIAYYFGSSAGSARKDELAAGGRVKP